MKHFFFLVLFFVLLAGFISCSSSQASSNSLTDNDQEEAISPATPLVTPVTGSPMQPIMRAIELIEFVSKFSNSEETKSFGIAKMHSALEDNDGRDDSEADRLLMKEKVTSITLSTDPVTAAASYLVYGLAKALAFLISLLRNPATLVNPGAWSAAESKGSSNSPLENMIDYETITASIRSLPERAFRLLDIPDEPACQSRAMCEVGQSVGGYLPAAISRWIRYLAERFNLNGGKGKDGFNTEAILRGLAWSDCKSSYGGGCPRSPFKKFQQLIATFSKLY